MTSQTDGFDMVKKEEIVTLNKKQQAVVLAAMKVFSQYGLTGASMDQIAEQAGMSKSNIFYYFSSKEELYTMVLSYVLTEWLVPLKKLSVDQEPAEALSEYIEIKFQLSKKLPQASKIYALEIMQGAPHLTDILKGPLKKLVWETVAVIEHWIAEGKVKPMEPVHLIFSMWAITQHYADFAVQIQSITGKTLSNKVFFAEAIQNAKQLVFSGVLTPKGQEPLLTIPTPDAT
jgi:TetR/AcrR family transcriptional regulator